MDIVGIIALWNDFLEALNPNGYRPKGYSDLDEAKRAITNYITGYYSQVRPHHNGGLTPNESERLYRLEYKIEAKIS